MSKPRSTAPRGGTRELLFALGRVQDMVGKAWGVAHDDRNPHRMDILDPLLKGAFDECVRARGLYPPIEERP